MRTSLLLSFPVLLLGACSSPRTILWDGTVAKPGHVRVEADKVLSLPSVSIGSYFDVLSKASDKLDGEKISRNDLVVIEKAAVASSLEKLGAGVNFTAAVGLGAGLEGGFRMISGNTGGDLRWQFLEGEQGDWNGGVGLSYTRNSFDLYRVVDAALGMEFKRQDLVMPLAFGVQKGTARGFHTNLACGTAIAWTRVNYSLNPITAIDDSVATLQDAEGASSTDAIRRTEVIPPTEQDFFSFGIHGLVQPGWRWIHFTVGGSLWYTDYGKYSLPEGGRVRLRGVTFQPALGLALKF